MDINANIYQHRQPHDQGGGGGGACGLEAQAGEEVAEQCQEAVPPLLSSDWLDIGTAEKSSFRNSRVTSFNVVENDIK